MDAPWQIKDWNDVFEDHKSRAKPRLTKFLPFPLNRDSEAYRLLMIDSEGVTAYGVFCALVRVAAQCPTRGVLADDKGVLTPQRLAVRTGIPVAVLEAAIARLSGASCGWLLRVPQAPAARPTRVRRASAARPKTATHNSTGQDITPQDKTPQGAAAPLLAGVGDVDSQLATDLERDAKRRPSRQPPPIPAALDTEEFRDAWAAWLRYCGRRKPPDETVKRLFAKLEAWGVERAVAAIWLSIDSVWKSIYEGKGNDHGGHKRSRADRNAGRVFTNPGLDLP